MPTVPKWINDVLEKMAPSMLRMVKVVNTTYINTNLKKIRVKGDFSTLNFDSGFTISFRVNANDLRHYTVSYGNTEEGIMESIVYLHGDAVGSNFIDELKPGEEEIKMAVLGSDKQYNPEIKKQLIFGDETSLSLMASFLPALKQNQHEFQFYIELDEENKGIPEILGLKNYIIFSKQDVFRNREKIRKLPLFKDNEWTDANIVLTGNVTSLQNFRKILKEKNHKGKIYVKGYWLEGKKGL